MQADAKHQARVAKSAAAIAAFRRQIEYRHRFIGDDTRARILEPSEILAIPA